MRHEPSRLLAADLLQRVPHPEADDLVGTVDGREEVLQPRPVGEHDVDHLLGPAQRVGMTTLKHVGELFAHAASIARRRFTR